MADYEQPKIFTDLLTLYKIWYQKHKHMPKYFRVTLGDRIMNEMTDGMKLITKANFEKDITKDFEEGAQHLQELRAGIEILKTYFVVAWEMEFISHGFYIELSGKLKEVSKQATSWHKWFRKKSNNE